jgi:ABC-2 type transport system permease protein
VIPLLAAELIKLRRSLVLLVAFAAPACVSAFAALALATRTPGAKWERFLDEGLAMWSFFMLPMSVTALTMLLAQMEHGSRMWRHLLVLPLSPARLFLAKALVALLLLVSMQVLIYAGLYLAGLSVDAVLPGRQLRGDMQMDDMAVGLAAMAVGAGPMIVIQLGVALFSRSFVTPLIIGILGTFFALVITASGTDLYIPWLLQIYATMWPKDRGVLGVAVALAGLAVTVPLMLAILGRRTLA